MLTQRNNNERTGAAIVPGLNQDTVTSRRWTQLMELPVDGTVYAQPLLVTRLFMPGSRAPRDVLYVATSQNRLYAFDATTLDRHPLWSRVLRDNDLSTIGSAGCDSISAKDGIGTEATPVIDRESGTLYVSYRYNNSLNRKDKAAARQRIAAIDIHTGAIRAHDVSPPTGSSNWHVWHRSRASLLLLNGIVYVAYGSRCEDPGQQIFHGWIIAFDAKTLRQVGAFKTTPNVLSLRPPYSRTVDGGGIWQAAVGLAADNEGNIYFMTGNRRLGKPGEYDSAPRDATNLADSFIKLKPTVSRAFDGSVARVGFHVSDSFTPYRKLWLDNIDLDLGSAGPVLVPGTRYLMGGGKQGIMYVINRDDMGKLDERFKWTGAMLDMLTPDATAWDKPEDWHADHVVQKFQVGYNQYVPEGVPYLPRQKPSFFGPSIAAAWQTNEQRDLFVVGRDGSLWVLWKVGNDQWTDGTSGRRGPARITPANFLPTEARIATAKQADNQLDAFAVRDDGAIWVTWEVDNKVWTDGDADHGYPAKITPSGLTPPGAHLAADRQSANQIDTFVVGNDGAVYVTWVVGSGHWSDGTPGNPPPARITPANFAPPGACLATAYQTNDQLDVFVVGHDGAIHVTWVIGLGIWSDGEPGHDGPARITPLDLAPPGAHLAADKQTVDQLNTFVVGNDGAIHVTWVIGTGIWTDGGAGHASPATISPRLARPGGQLAITSSSNRMDAYVVGNNSAVWNTWEENNGPWRDGIAGRDPASLMQAVWMNGWFAWPHIHGAPLYADYGDGRRYIYVWPEKDHLKAFPWLGNKFDIEHRILGSAKDGTLVLAPPGPPFGMPGGMLAATVDPTKNGRGILFASIARPDDRQQYGLLRAFDPITLRELWNNAGDHYEFVKFAPPTCGNGRVFLPTSSGKVLVYGLSSSR